MFCCRSFQQMKGRFATCDCLLSFLVCVWTGHHRNSSPRFLSAKSDVYWHRYLLCTFTQRRPCSCWTTSGLLFSSKWTKALHFPTTNKCASCFAWIFVVPWHDRSCPFVRPQYMYSCSNWGLCFSGFFHCLHDSQKSVLAFDKHGKLAAGIRVQPRELDLFPCKVSCAMNGIFRGCLSFSRRSWSFEFTRAAQMPVQPAIPSPLVLGNCALCWKQFLLPVITPRRTKVFLGRFCSGVTGLRLRSATRASALSPSLRARASGHWRRVPACEHTCKEKREESMIISRLQKTCPEIQLSELPLGPEMKRMSEVLGRSFLFWSASALCTEKLKGFFFRTRQHHTTQESGGVWFFIAATPKHQIVVSHRSDIVQNRIKVISR